MLLRHEKLLESQSELRCSALTTSRWKPDHDTKPAQPDLPRLSPDFQDEILWGDVLARLIMEPLRERILFDPRTN